MFLCLCVCFRAEQASSPLWCDSVINLYASDFTPMRGEGIQPAGDTHGPLAAHARKHAPMHTRGACAQINSPKSICSSLTHLNTQKISPLAETKAAAEQFAADDCDFFFFVEKPRVPAGRHAPSRDVMGGGKRRRESSQQGNTCNYRRVTSDYCVNHPA